MYNEIEKVIDGVFLEELKNENHTKSYVLETIALLERKLAGDDPSEEEWRDNANAYDYDYANANTIANAIANANANAYANAYANAFTFCKSKILARLKGIIPPVEELDLKIYRSVAEEKKYRLNMHSWNSPRGKSRCRAGAAITEHPRGGELKKYLGSKLAGEFIYEISTGSVPNFHCSDEVAWEDIKRCAGVA